MECSFFGKCKCLRCWTGKKSFEAEVPGTPHGVGQALVASPEHVLSRAVISQILSGCFQVPSKQEQTCFLDTCATVLAGCILFVQVCSLNQQSAEQKQDLAGLGDPRLNPVLGAASRSTKVLMANHETGVKRRTKVISYGTKVGPDFVFLLEIDAHNYLLHLRKNLFLELNCLVPTSWTVNQSSSSCKQGSGPWSFS